MNTRPVSVSHLVFGLIFLGAAVMWAVGAATDADVPDMAVIAPAVLIAAGTAGLIAIVFNARNARIGGSATETPADPAHDLEQDLEPDFRGTEPAGTDTPDPEYADTVVAEHEERKS